MKQLLVKSGLKLFCYYQYLVVIFFEFLSNVVICHTVIIHVCLSALSTVAIFYFARECHQRLDCSRVFFRYDTVYDLLVVSSYLTRIANNHSFCLMVYLLDCELHELVNNHARFTQLDILLFS